MGLMLPDLKNLPTPASDVCSLPGSWQSSISTSISTLKVLAGTTEDEFLQIGARLQEFYQRSSDISSMADQLLENVSGELVQSLIARLRNMMNDMDVYLVSARSQSSESCRTLGTISDLLGQVEQPLEGFHKMYKTLRMLGISTKIESSRIGEKGLGFLTLAMDVEKLSHQVNDKSASILGHSQVLAGMIKENLDIVHLAEFSQDSEVSKIFKSITSSLEELVSVNDNCSRFGSLVASVSAEVSGNIGEVVASMQVHDITRQQLEHIVEALERLETDLSSAVLTGGCDKGLITEVGDVCDLQVAQLRHSASELSGAVLAIIDNLRDIASKQSSLTEQTLSAMGIDDSGGHSFVEDISCGMTTVTDVLSKCAETDRELSVTMKKVAETISEISVFVADIEEIGTEIDLIALNSQIMAAHTGKDGASLGVLAEAIKRLSLEAVIQTESVSKTLMDVKDVTGHILSDATKEVEEVTSHISVMEKDLNEILGSLAGMNNDLFSQIASLNRQVVELSQDIEGATGGIVVHEKTAQIAEEVFAQLDGIVAKAREIAPASTKFEENLRHMEERYTMQSERNIHEAIAKNRSGGPSATLLVNQPKAAETESEFGDNVDLF